MVVIVGKEGGEELLAYAEDVLSSGKSMIARCQRQCASVVMKKKTPFCLKPELKQNNTCLSQSATQHAEDALRQASSIKVSRVG